MKDLNSLDWDLKPDVKPFHLALDGLGGPNTRISSVCDNQKLNIICLHFLYSLI